MHAIIKKAEYVVNKKAKTLFWENLQSEIAFLYR